MSKITEQEERWHSLEAFVAACESAAKITENSGGFNCTILDMNTFQDLLKEKGFSILPIKATLQNKVSDASSEDEYLKWLNEVIRFNEESIFGTGKDDIQVKLLKQVKDKYASIVNEKDNIPADFKQVTGHNSPKEMIEYEKGREDEQQVIMKWIEKWNGSSNSVMGATLKKVLKKFERKDSADIEEKLKLECRRIKIQRNEYEQKLIRTRRKVSRLNAIIKSQLQQKEVEEYEDEMPPL